MATFPQGWTLPCLLRVSWGPAVRTSQVSRHTHTQLHLADLESAQAQSPGIPGVPACLSLSLTWQHLMALSGASSTAQLPHTHLGSYTQRRPQLLSHLPLITLGLAFSHQDHVWSFPLATLPGLAFSSLVPQNSFHISFYDANLTVSLPCSQSSNDSPLLQQKVLVP